MPALLIAAAALPAGFAVAQATGVRPLGGIVLVVLALLAARAAGLRTGRQLAWYVGLAVCFAASHLLAGPLGAWGAVALVTAIATGVFAALTGSGRG